MRCSVISLIACILIALLSSPAIAKKRVALVIGNSDYEFAGTLDNPANDAEDIQAALKQLGFKVIYDIDLEKPNLEAKLQEFGKALTGAEIGLFFYAGHGLQVDGKNYIMPIDAELTEGEHMLPHELVELKDIQTTMGAAKTKIILLDACRNNPLARNLKKALGTDRSAAVGHGLAEIKARIGTLIGYSTHPGAVAKDGKGGRNSPFSAALKSHILTPGLSLDSMLKRVRRDVIAATGGRQVPWDSDSLVEDVYLGGQVEIPAGGEGDAGYRARLTKQIETSKSVVELDTLKRLEPAFAPMIEARKKQLAFLQEQEEKRKREAEEEAKRKEAEAKRRGEKQARKKAEDTGRKRDPALSVKPGSGETFRDCDDCPEMVLVPAGWVKVGTPSNDEYRNENEELLRHVDISQSFAVGKFEIKWDEWETCVREGGCKKGPHDEKGWGKRSRPVINTSWLDANDYANWLSRKTGMPYRLLSEAEWEYVARAGSNSRYWWGNEVGAGNANCLGCGSSWGGKRTAPVGMFKRNGFGLFDVLGNAWEWVKECYREKSGEGAAVASVQNNRDCKYRVIRGGSWFDGPQAIRSASREGYLPEQSSNLIGFRVARDLTH